MSRYSDDIAMVLELVKADGQPVTWKKPNLVPNPEQPWKTADPAEATTYSVDMVFLKPQGGLRQTLNRLMRGTDVPEGGPRALMGAVSFTPDMTDIVIRNGVEMRVKNFDVLAPSGDPILYDIEFHA
jgi:hypothetical protein